MQTVLAPTDDSTLIRLEGPIDGPEARFLRSPFERIVPGWSTGRVIPVPATHRGEQDRPRHESCHTSARTGRPQPTDGGRSVMLRRSLEPRHHRSDSFAAGDQGVLGAVGPARLTLSRW
jgi:hypothetical protein